MIATSDLIDRLAASAPPVRRLRPPLTRAACWLLSAAIILSLLAFGHGLRADLSQRLQQGGFVAGVTASALTGVLAAVAAFFLSLPDRSRLWLLLPGPALVAWLSMLGYQCLTDWVSLDLGGIRLGETARCFATLVLTSLPLSLLMIAMLRYAALLRPTAAAIAGGLAVAAFTATGLSLFHALDAAAMILAWNLGTAALMLGLAGLLVRKISGRTPPASPSGNN